jgi:hypothetical protein
MGCRVQAWDDTLLLSMSFFRWILMKQIIQSQPLNDQLTTRSPKTTERLFDNYQSDMKGNLTKSFYDEPHYMVRAWTFGILCERFHHYRYLLPTTKKIARRMLSPGPTVKRNFTYPRKAHQLKEPTFIMVLGFNNRDECYSLGIHVIDQWLHG